LRIRHGGGCCCQNLIARNREGWQATIFPSLVGTPGSASDPQLSELPELAPSPVAEYEQTASYFSILSFPHCEQLKNKCDRYFDTLDALLVCVGCGSREVDLRCLYPGNTPISAKRGLTPTPDAEAAENRPLGLLLVVVSLLWTCASGNT
jgi:hypothetical protein